VDNQEALFQKIVLFTAAVHQVTHDISKDIRPTDITPVQYRILEYIAVGQPVTLSQISECQNMSMPNTSRELKKLCEKQICEKFTDPTDRRKQYIRLTSKGTVVMNEVFAQIHNRLQQRLEGASQAKINEISDALTLLQNTIFRIE